jgi:hypothetical protein
MKPGSAPPVHSNGRRNRGLVILDPVAAVLLAFISGSFMFFLIDQGTVLLQPFGVPLMILAVVSWFAGTAMFILFAVRRRVSFYWPVVGIIATQVAR